MQSAFGFLLGDDDDPPRAWLAALLSNAQLATLLSLSFLPHRTQLITNAKPTLTQPKQVTMVSAGRLAGPPSSLADVFWLPALQESIQKV